MRRASWRALPAVGVLLLAASGVRADVRLSPIFTEAMVLQQGTKVPIWGTAARGEQVTVTFGEQRAAATANDKGDWRATLGPLKAGGPFELTVAGKNTLVLKDVLVGEVWVCSGQSNMALSLQNARNGKEEASKADYPRIRLFTVPMARSALPRKEYIGSGPWKACSPTTAPGFSAVAYYFGRDLHKALNVPVGLIHCSVSGTPAQAWISRVGLESEPTLQPLLAGRPLVGTRPAKWEMPTVLFNGMVAPTLPYAIRGAIWYQGESDVALAAQYRVLFPAMIRDWRRAWGQGDVPFLFVQLPNFMATQKDPNEKSDWAELREAQVQTLALPNTGMAVTIDLGEAGNIHPKNKEDVGRRLALIAENAVYGKNVVASGPMFDSMTVEGGKARLRFKHADGGLQARGGDLEGFAIAGTDGKFVWADAKIDGETVVIESKEVPEPAAVRYGWANNPTCTLYNKTGLPASPFRTDTTPFSSSRPKG